MFAVPSFTRGGIAMLLMRVELLTPSVDVLG
jgi:heme/copper-type cytochrome/quinol oxidase subunit 1